MANATEPSLGHFDSHRLLRRLIGIGLGLVMTVVLFLVMQALIKSDRSPFTDAPIGRIVDFVRLLEDTPIDEINSKPPPPPEVDELPPELPKHKFQPTAIGPGTGIDPGPLDTPIDIGPKGAFTDGEYLPLVKVRPDYPRRAQTRGIEGYVILEFTVTKSGSVANPVVIEAEPPDIFNRAAINAALKFKYKPKVLNGESIDVAGVLHKITFELADE